MAWNFRNPFSRFVTPRPAPSLDAAQSGAGQPTMSYSHIAASVNPHPHWFNHAVGNDGSHAPTLNRFIGLGHYQAGHVGIPGAVTFNPYQGTYAGSSPITGQVASA